MEKITNFSAYGEKESIKKRKQRMSFLVLCCIVLFISSKVAGAHVGRLESYNGSTYVGTFTTGLRNRRNIQYKNCYSGCDARKKTPIRYGHLNYRKETQEVLIVGAYMRKPALDVLFPQELIALTKHFYLCKKLTDDTVMNKWFDCTEDNLRVKEAITIYKHFYIDLRATRGAMHGASALHNAAYFHVDAKLLHFLLKKGAPINIRNRWGDTPLHSAMASQNLLAARILKNWGADVDAKNKLDETPDLLQKFVQERERKGRNRYLRLIKSTF